MFDETQSKDAARAAAQTASWDAALSAAAASDSNSVKSRHEAKQPDLDLTLDGFPTVIHGNDVHPANSRDVGGDVESSPNSNSGDEEQPSGGEQQQHRLDGGLRAWMAVLVLFLTQFLVFGFIYSFGIYQKEYATLFPDSSDLVRSLSGTVGPAILWITGPFSGRLAERVGFQRTILAGGIILSLGIILSGLSTQAWHAVLTQGVMFGAGASLMYFPTISLPAQWWVKRRSLAVGIAVSGAGVGGLVINNVSIALIPVVGLMWTLRILGIASLVISLMAAAIVRTRLAPRPNDGSPVIDTKLLRNRRVWPLILTSFFMLFGYLLPYYMLPQYIQDVYAQPSLAITLLTVINVLAIVGRIAMGWVADRLGNVNCFVACILAVGVSMLVFWLPADPARVALLYVFVIGYGFFGGGFISLMPTVAAQLYGIEKLPSIVGLIYAATVPGSLVGYPIALAIAQSAKNAAAAAANVPADTAAAANPEAARAIANAATAALGPGAQYTLSIVFASLCVFVAATSASYLRFGVLDRRVRTRI